MRTYINTHIHTHAIGIILILTYTHCFGVHSLSLTDLYKKIEALMEKSVCNKCYCKAKYRGMKVVVEKNTVEE